MRRALIIFLSMILFSTQAFAVIPEREFQSFKGGIASFAFGNGGAALKDRFVGLPANEQRPNSDDYFLFEGQSSHEQYVLYKNIKYFNYNSGKTYYMNVKLSFSNIVYSGKVAFAVKKNSYISPIIKLGYGISSLKLKYEFFSVKTGKKLKVRGNISVGDIDGGQYVKLYKSSFNTNGENWQNNMARKTGASSKLKVFDSNNYRTYLGEGNTNDGDDYRIMSQFYSGNVILIIGGIASQHKSYFLEHKKASPRHLKLTYHTNTFKFNKNLTGGSKFADGDHSKTVFDLQELSVVTRPHFQKISIASPVKISDKLYYPVGWYRGKSCTDKDGAGHTKCLTGEESHGIAMTRDWHVHMHYEELKKPNINISDYSKEMGMQSGYEYRPNTDVIFTVNLINGETDITPTNGLKANFYINSMNNLSPKEVIYEFEQGEHSDEVIVTANDDEEEDDEVVIDDEDDSSGSSIDIDENGNDEDYIYDSDEIDESEIDLIELSKIVIPKNESQIAFVKFHTPQTEGAINIVVQVVLNFHGAELEFVKSFDVSIKGFNFDVPLDPKLTDKKSDINPLFKIETAPLKSEESLSKSWSVWEATKTDTKDIYGDKIFTFSKKNFNAKVQTLELSLIPNKYVNTKTKQGKVFEIKSGYGFDTNLLSRINSNSDVSISPLQTFVYSFPEFSYDKQIRNKMFKRIGQFSTLTNLSCSTDETVSHLNPNDDSLYGAGSHFTPIWFPDGQYIVHCYSRDGWTPAGEIKANITAVININGSMLDDYHIGEK